MERASGDDLSRLVDELGTIVRRVLSESPQVAHALDRIRAEGYQAAVTLEATIGVSRVGRRGGSEAGKTVEMRGEEAEPPPLKMTPLDKKFLRSLKITVEDED